MNLIKTIDQYNEDCVYFCEPIKNTIMNEGNFIRIIYSNPYFMLNGIYLSIDIHKMTIEKYYNKFKCKFDVNECKHIIEQLKIIEDGILNKIDIRDKICQKNIYDQFKSGQLKIFSETMDTNNTIITNTSFLLKISGVWETDLYYGLTFKLIKL